MNHDQTLQGVHCDVTTCAYNESGKLCHAKRIEVANQVHSCNSKIDTFCGTFRAKPQAEPQGRH